MEASGMGVSGERTSTFATIAPERRLMLLKEWRSALLSIVARDPSAAETRRTIKAIEAQIVGLEKKSENN